MNNKSPKVDFNGKDFKELYGIIKENMNILNQINAINIVINCCIICTESHKKELFAEWYLKEILNIAYSFISNPTDKQLLHYIQAVYHIVKYSTEKVSK